jgi:CheY-like chemotaxis protein
MQTDTTDNSIPGFSSISARILLAEDNPASQQLILLILKKLGFAAYGVANGSEALNALEREPFDLVLMDMHMPEMDGLEATRVIRKQEKEGNHHGSLSRIPVIALTAYSVPDDKERCLEAGVDDYLTKPVSPSTLAETLKKWLPEEK